MSSKRLDAISDYQRHGYMLRIDCLGCRRVVIIDPWQIVQMCQRRQLSRQMSVLVPRLRCSACGSKRVKCGPAFGRS